MQQKNRYRVIMTASIGFAAYVSYWLLKRFKSLRIILKNAQAWNIINVIKLCIYTYNYHLPILMNDILILLLLHKKPNGITLNAKPKQILSHYLFIFACHALLSLLCRPNTCRLFETLVEKPINQKLSEQIVAINDLLHEQLSHTPYLKEIVWEYVGMPMENIDVDELVQTKAYAEHLRKLFIEEQHDTNFNFVKEMFYNKYHSIIQWIETGLNVLYSDGYEDYPSLRMRFMYDQGSYRYHLSTFQNDSRASWLIIWTMLRIAIHIAPRLIVPLLFYSIIGTKSLNIMDSKSAISQHIKIVATREPIIFAFVLLFNASKLKL